MKKTLAVAAAIIAILLPVLSLAQTAGTQDATQDATKSLEIARNMMLAAAGIGDDFKSFKGDFVMKDGSDNSYYQAKGIELGTESQYVIVKPDGKTVLAAIYKQKDNDDKTPIMAFTAFTGGIITLTGGKDFSVEQDKSLDDAKSLKYFLIVNTLKVASFTFDVESKEGTLLVTFQ